jgi:hypothetical protein
MTIELDVIEDGFPGRDFLVIRHSTQYRPEMSMVMTAQEMRELVAQWCDLWPMAEP